VNRGPVRKYGILFFARPKKSIQKKEHQEPTLRCAESPALLTGLGAVYGNMGTSSERIALILPTLQGEGRGGDGIINNIAININAWYPTPILTFPLRGKGRAS
jgi:hypothetical protein